MDRPRLADHNEPEVEDGVDLSVIAAVMGAEVHLYCFAWAKLVVEVLRGLVSYDHLTGWKKRML